MRREVGEPWNVRLAIEDWVERRHRPKAACPTGMLRERRLGQGGRNEGARTANGEDKPPGFQSPRGSLSGLLYLLSCSSVLDRRFLSHLSAFLA